MSQADLNFPNLGQPSVPGDPMEWRGDDVYQTSLQEPLPHNGPTIDINPAVPFRHNKATAEDAVHVSLQAEEMILGILLFDPKAFYAICRKVRAEYFYPKSHQDIYQAICELAGKGVATNDMIAVAGLMEDAGNPVQLGYLGRLIGDVCNVANIDHYADILIDRWQKRQIKVLFARSGDQINKGLPAGKVLGDMLSQLVQMTESTRSRWETLDNAAGELIRHNEQLWRGEISTPILPTFVKAADKVLSGGSEVGEIVVIGGQSGTGKTIFMVQSSIVQARAGYKVAVFSMEMPPRKLIRRSTVTATGIATSRQRSMTVSESEFVAINNAIAAIKRDCGKNYHFRYGPLTSEEWDLEARAAVAQYGIQSIWVDHAQNIPGHETVEGFNRICATMQRFSQDHPNVNLFVLSQLNSFRGDDKRPTTASLLGATSLRNMADIVLLLHRPEQVDPTTLDAGIIEIIGAKLREGGGLNGEVRPIEKALFDGPNASIKEYDPCS